MPERFDERRRRRPRPGHRLGDELGDAVASDLAARFTGTALLHETLLARGFLVSLTSDEEGAGAVAMREPRDREALARYVELHDRPGVTTLGFRPGPSHAEQARELLTDGLPDGRWTRMDRRHLSGWSAFRKLRFGRRIPVDELDLGIALLVRTLPLVVIATYFSGHGRHDVFHLRVDLDGPYARAWLRFVLERELRHALPVEDVEVLRDGLRYGRRLQLAPPGTELGPALDGFWRGQRLARLLMDRPRTAELRARHHAIADRLDTEHTEAPPLPELRAACEARWGPPIWPRAEAADDDRYAPWLRADLGPCQRVVRESPWRLAAHTVLPAQRSLASMIDDELEELSGRGLSTEELATWDRMTTEVGMKAATTKPETATSTAGWMLVASSRGGPRAQLSVVPEACLQGDDPRPLLAHLREIVAATRTHPRFPELVFDVAPARWCPAVDAAFHAVAAELRAAPIDGVRCTWVTGY